MSSSHSTQEPMTAAMNSREWWEQYFSEQWADNHGSAQTRHFMERLLANLSPTVLQYLKNNTLDLLDWGCAFGEGVAVLSEHFPQCRVKGLDFAANALVKARELHPGHEFIHSADGSLTQAFDVILTSNCLEHLAQPLDVVAQQLPFCRALYLALVPYDEHPLHEQHRSQFRQESFPEKIGEFIRLTTRVITVEPLFWPGQQLLVIYAAPQWLAKHALPTDATQDQEQLIRILTLRNNELNHQLKQTLVQYETQLQAMAQERDQARSLYEQARRQLDEIYNSTYWKVLSVYWSFRNLLRSKKTSNT